MDSGLKSELNSCINELYSIANGLEEAAEEVAASIKGMNTKPYTNTLYDCAKKYRSAASKLSRIR